MVLLTILLLICLLVVCLQQRAYQIIFFESLHLLLIC